MRILYAIQGTGNGHMARALEIVPALMRHGEVDILVSGSQCEIELPWPVKYKLHGMGFVFGKKGGIDVLKTFKQFNLLRFVNEARSVPVDKYDMVINDFEPVTAWACLFKRVTCVGLSHQCAVMGAHAPRPLRVDIFGALVLQLYAPTKYTYGFHFGEYDNSTFSPVIRQDVRLANPVVENHYTVYLPAYDDFAIVDFLTQFPSEYFEVFSKHNKKPFSYMNVAVTGIDKNRFAKSVTSAKGVFCNAGFETPAETLFLKKKLCVIPMIGQYEQQCNAFALQKLGVPVLRGLGHKQAVRSFGQWLDDPSVVAVDYPNQTIRIVDGIIARHVPGELMPNFAFPSGF